MPFIPYLSVLLVFWSASVPAASGMRCENGLVDRGDGIGEVRETCGEPSRRDSVILYRPLQHEARGFFVPTRREKWLYNFGGNRLMREVVIENGRVTEILVGERGY